MFFDNVNAEANPNKEILLKLKLYLPYYSYWSKKLFFYFSLCYDIHSIKMQVMHLQIKI